MHRMIIRSLSIVVLLLKKYKKKLRNNDVFLIYIFNSTNTYPEEDKISFHPKNRVSRTILLRTLRVILIFRVV